MINNQPTEVLGNSIACWDQFYTSNYKWVFRSSCKVLGDPTNAKSLTEKIFLTTQLKHPEFAIEMDSAKFMLFVSQEFPSLDEALIPSSKNLARELVKDFYCAN